MALIAHVGHDLVSLAFFVPVIAFLAWLAVDQVRARRGTRKGGRDSGPHAPRPDPDA